MQTYSGYRYLDYNAQACMYLWYSIYTRGAWHAYAPQADVENDP